MSDYVFAKEAVVTFHNGVKVRTKRDEAWDADDPFVKARPDLFTGAPEKVQDTADAEPPKRGPGRPRKS